MNPVRRSNIYKIGITGNMGTGKSVVRHALQRLGLSTLDSMDHALDMLVDNPNRMDIRLTDHFGEVLDNRGRLSRRKLKTLLYSDPRKRSLFEDKMGPSMRDEMKKFLFSPMGSPIRAMEMPLLLEMNLKHLYDEVWVVTCAPEQQIERLMQREHLRQEQVELMLAGQMAMEEKTALGDRVIDNAGGISQTEQQVKAIYEEIKNKAFKPI